MRRLSIVGVILLFCALFCAVQNSPAQVSTGNIIGHVTDPTGAALVDAEVIAVDPAKGTSSTATTDAEGMYRILYLEPATYNVTIHKTGFSTLQRSQINLRANDTLTIDLQLTMGTVSDKIEVTGATRLLETATSTTGTVLEGKQMNSLPIQQRYTWMTMYLMPGVTSMNGFHITGPRDRGLGYTMDGISGTQP
ncbi:MAG: carboxypeptidase-like regulatory domain-containing protein, partial [Acidobacteriota bacterium]|nr:carboxypeptidase-like regulatory domain-containing protein [Acidobacteriota bacterium]